MRPTFFQKSRGEKKTIQPVTGIVYFPMDTHVYIDTKCVYYLSLVYVYIYMNIFTLGFMGSIHIGIHTFILLPRARPKRNTTDTYPIFLGGSLGARAYPRNLSGKFALVTGGDSGLGFSIALALAKHGAEVGFVAGR